MENKKVIRISVTSSDIAKVLATILELKLI